MSANIAVVSPPEETTSVVTCNRIVCFVNDDLSTQAKKPILPSNLEHLTLPGDGRNPQHERAGGSIG